MTSYEFVWGLPSEYRIKDELSGEPIFRDITTVFYRACDSDTSHLCCVHNNVYDCLVSSPSEFLVNHFYNLFNINKYEIIIIMIL